MERGEVIEGRFRIEGNPREGGMGAVYRAVDLTDNSVVAVKFLVPAAARSALDGWRVAPTLSELRRFEREIRLYELLGGVGLPYLVHHGRFRRRPYLVMQYIDGTDLREFLNKYRPGVAVSVAVVVQILETLIRVHEARIVHRDIKPRNILLERATGHVYTGDLGIALLLDPDATRYTEGQTPGTSGYKAPEVISGEKNPTGAADVYGAACLLFELLTGRLVFEYPGNDFKMSQAHLYEPPPPLDEVLHNPPPLLTELLLRMLAKDPGHRPSTREAAGALRPLLPKAGDPAPDPAIDPDPTLPYRRPERRTPSEPVLGPRPTHRSRGRHPGGFVDQHDVRRTLIAAYDEIHRVGTGPAPESDRLTDMLPAAQRRWGPFAEDVLTARVLVADRERLHKDGIGASKRYREIVRDLTGIAQPGEPMFAPYLSARLGLAECRLSETDDSGQVDEILATWGECAADLRHAPVDTLLGQRHLVSLIREIGQYIAECGHSDCDHPATVAAVLKALPAPGEG
ncbi:serine/threonine-protein kinase [Streptomyces sp. NPDC005571]|uniref:serine/threonine protein kinase n=1 Tax=Streptomyces sp. NPDC005571 TaxID=3156888 RepID=UPI0033A9FEDA